MKVACSAVTMAAHSDHLSVEQMVAQMAALLADLLAA
jgi:hypothetical protein